MVNRKTFDNTPASLFKWSPFTATVQPYNDILERAGRSRVESAMCVCYELMQTAGGHGEILADGGTPRPFFACDFRFDHLSYGLQRAQSEQHFSRKIRRQERRYSPKKRDEKLVARRERVRSEERRVGKEWRERRC